MKKLICTVAILFACLPGHAFELATKTSKTGDTAKLETVGYSKVILLREKTSLSGSITATGSLNISGTANVVMWCKVGNAYYFSKLPMLQNISNKKNVAFEIPFNAADKVVTEVLIEVEMLSEGAATISNFQIDD